MDAKVALVALGRVARWVGALAPHGCQVRRLALGGTALVAPLSAPLLGLLA